MCVCVCVCSIHICLADFKHGIEVNCNLNVPKLQETVSQSPKFSLALSMYSSGFMHKKEVTRSRQICTLNENE